MARGPGIALASGLLDRAGFAHGFSVGDGAAPPADFALLRDPVRLEGALRAFGAATDLPGDAIWQCTQVHGRAVVIAGAPPAETATASRRVEADALVARAAGSGAPRAVGVRVADCVPVLLADTRTGDVAAVHAGWKGLVGGVVEAALEVLLAPAASRAAGGGRVLAAIGPCIGPCCFEVGADVAARIVEATGAGAEADADGVVAGRHVRDGVAKAHVDLRRAARRVLARAGVDAACVEDVPGCSRCEPRFHSFRRDGDASGRMLAAIAPRPPRP